MENSHQRKSWLRWAWAAGAAGLVWWAWPVLRPLGAQVLWGYGMALLALPLARWLEKRLSPGLSAGLALAALGLAAAGIVGLVLPMLGRQIRQFAALAPGWWEQLRGWVQAAEGWLANRGMSLSQVDWSRLEDWLAEAGAGLWRRAGNFTAALGRLLLVPALAFYFVRDRQAIARHLCVWIPLGWRGRVVAALREARRELAGFCRGQALLSLAVGGLTAAGLAIIGIPAWLVLGLLMGLMETIPYLGPWLAAAPAILCALPLGLSKTLWTLGILLAVQQAEGAFLSPALMAGATRLHPAVVLLAISAGGLAAGVWGMLLALPALVCLRGFWRVMGRPMP